MNDYNNTQLGQYQLIEAIGHGGMATVYKAYQETLDRYVAVKVLLSNRDPQFAARFKREARAIAALQHHNILPIYDYGEQNGLLYFVMQYVDTGITLHDMLGRPIAPIEALQLIGHVLHALDYAHTRGVIHRDIKPANILLPSPTWALLADFGIAKLMNDSQHLTMTGFIIGTAAYMAPEQAAGKPIDARTDLYSLGVVLYEMLTGRVPFDAETPMAMLTKHVYEPPPPPHIVNPDLSPLLETVLLRVLEKDPNERYQTAAEMAADLERVILHLGRPRPSSQITSLYQAGLDAFEHKRYDEARKHLSQLVALDPSYEDATLMLKAAQAAQARALERDAAIEPTGTPSTENEPIVETPAPATSGRQTSKEPPSTATPADTTSKSSVTPPGGGGAPAADEIRCPRCGLNVRADWQACPFCRAPLNPAPAGAAEAREARMAPIELHPAPVSKPAWQRWAIVAALVLLIGGAGGAWAWSRRTSNPAVVPPAIAAAASATPTSTFTPTVSPTPTSTPTQTSTQTPTPTPSDTATPAPTNSPPATATPRPPDAIVTGTQQRLRSGPGQSYAILGTYTQGTALTITGKDASGAWIQVAAPDGQAGWMLAANVQVNLALGDIAVVEAPPSPTPSSTPKPKPTPKPTLTPEPPTLTPEPPTLTPEPPTLTPTPTKKPSHNNGGCTNNCPVPP